MSELGNQLNQQTEQKDNSKLYWGISCGILGISLISLIIYLVLKSRREK